MNKRLSEAVSRLGELSEERQDAAASLLIHFIEQPETYELTPEQWAELEGRLDNDDYASDEEVQAFFARKKA